QGLVYLADAEERAKRLFVVSAGNVDDLGLKHLDRSDVEPIEDPGQAWNALTVGAYTTKVHIDPTDPTLNGWSPLAQDGELSPYSKTSVLFEPQWPVKPDVVLEGGNRGYEEGSNHAVQVDCLSLLTTNANMAQGLVTPTWGTSPAAAEGARLAMQIAHRYPSYWPETIRGLIAHSADWTPVMRGNLPKGAGRKAKLALLRRYGYGVPSLERALKSATNSLTLIAQARIRPFAEGKFREIRFYDLPWPKEVLFDLGKETVKMRVTLSYFIEPNPGRRGWRLKHRYASHGLRFDVKGPQESIDTFEKRLNDLALAEEEDQPKAQHDDLWYFGADARKKGSLHSDIWEGTAADLATSGVIAVVPTSGWWKDQPARDRSGLGARYALLVSIETAAEDVDIYTPVATELQIPIDVQIET
ncbi:MAG TPA: S8 family peptidase, partial [Planctomycetota bacterium]|nr:S8 family peptidase [Planctomycetota bacterium]